jgi:uncharacterized zinc-type alcohol dehydrogenase-like protein
MIPARAYAVHSAEDRFAPFSFERRNPRADDVVIAIQWCGVCHSDLHTARGEWTGTRYPCVPGHEIVGEVTAVGEAVTKFAVGDLAAVGCLVDSCKSCDSCNDGLEQYCERGFTGTYNGPEQGTGGNTYGGYSDSIVVREDFCLRIRHGRDQLAAVAPLLCAGITTWSPLKHWGAGPGKAVGVVGIGGLGHMGVKLAKALGAHVVAFTTSLSKVDDAKALGADEVVVSRDREAMKAQAGKLDLIINTVTVAHDLDVYVSLLRRDGTMVMLGAPPEPHPTPSTGLLVFKRRAIAGSIVGGIAETQEMLDFCAAHDIVSEVETIRMQDIEDAYARMLRSDVKYRFSIDMSSLHG